MISKIKEKSQEYWNQWIKTRISSNNPQTLGSNNLYILPSGFGWVYGLLLVTLFSGAINYQISSVFLMTFLLAVVGIVSAWEAHANLKEISIKLISIDDTQQGKPAQINLWITTNNKVRFGLEFQLMNQQPTRLEKVPQKGVHLILPLETTVRGCFPLPRIIVSSFFPFGIFRVWGYANFDAQYYVYPEPIFPGFWPIPLANKQYRKRNVVGDDEIDDLKQVENPWTQPNLIAWKIAAKGQGWYLKTRDSTEGDYWLFRLIDLPSEHLETKLQHLSYWLINAELQGYIYGLELSKSSILYARGEEHLQHCLRQLALF